MPKGIDKTYFIIIFVGRGTKNVLYFNHQPNTIMNKEDRAFLVKEAKKHARIAKQARFKNTRRAFCEYNTAAHLLLQAGVKRRAYIFFAKADEQWY